MHNLDLHSNESSNSFSSIRQIPAMTHLLPSLTLRWVPPTTEQYFLLHRVFLLPAGEHSTREGGRDDRLPGGRGKPLHHGTPSPLPPRELVRLHQVCPLPLGLHLHRLLVQYDDPHHPILGRPLHPAPPLQEQPGRRGWDCWLCQHPDDRDQGQSDVRHPHEGFNKERRISSSEYHQHLMSMEAKSMKTRWNGTVWIYISVVLACTPPREKAFILPINYLLGCDQLFSSNTGKCQQSADQDFRFISYSQHSCTSVWYWSQLFVPFSWTSI